MQTRSVATAVYSPVDVVSHVHTHVPPQVPLPHPLLVVDEISPSSHAIVPVVPSLSHR